MDKLRFRQPIYQIKILSQKNFLHLMGRKESQSIHERDVICAKHILLTKSERCGR
jgi:hypothetical protein